MLNRETLDWLERLGFDIADTVRSLRPGGPTDRLRFTLQCEANGHTAKRLLRDWALHEHACHCGSPFDSAPLDGLITLLHAGFTPQQCISAIQGIEVIASDESPERN